MNDSLQTTVFVQYPPETIACACIYLAARVLQVMSYLLLSFFPLCLIHVMIRSDSIAKSSELVLPLQFHGRGFAEDLRDAARRLPDCEGRPRNALRAHWATWHWRFAFRLLTTSWRKKWTPAGKNSSRTSWKPRYRRSKRPRNLPPIRLRRNKRVRPRVSRLQISQR